MSEKDPSSLRAAIEQIAQMLRKESKEYIAFPKRKISPLPSVGSANTIEQIAKMIRAEVSKKENVKKRKKTSRSSKKSSDQK